MDQSLLREEEGPGGEPRYAMLETVREYGLERLAASGEADSVRDRHAAWCLALAERGEIATWGGPEQTRWLDRLEAELPNLRAALAWCEGIDDPQPGLGLSGALAALWFHRSHRAEGRAWLERALARAGEVPSTARAKALRALASQELLLGGGRAVAHAAESLALWRDLDDSWRAADAQLVLGIALAHGAEPGRAPPVLEAAAAQLEALSEPYRAAVARLHLGQIALERGAGARAEALLGEVLALFRRGGYRWGVAHAALLLGQAAVDRGDRPAAAARYAEGIAAGDWVSSREGLVNVLAGVARLALATGSPLAATRLLAAAAARGEIVGHQVRPSERARRERAAAAAQAALGAAGFDAAWAAGRSLSDEQAAAAAAEVVAAVGSPTAVRGAADNARRLTRRELEVLRLLAGGRSDREIAGALFISPKTVGAHITSVLGKLGVSSRAAAVAYAHRHALA